MSLFPPKKWNIPLSAVWISRFTENLSTSVISCTTGVYFLNISVTKGFEINKITT